MQEYRHTIVMFIVIVVPLQKWLRKCASVLRGIYFAYLVQFWLAGDECRAKSYPLLVLI